jgi:hypothetical protein
MAPFQVETRVKREVTLYRLVPPRLGHCFDLGADVVIGEGAASAWLVPALMFLLVIVVSWLGLQWIVSEHLETLASIPLFKARRVARSDERNRPSHREFEDQASSDWANRKGGFE